MSEKFFDIICYKRTALIVLLLCISYLLAAQQQYELNTGWQCIHAATINKTGEEISNKNFLLKGWMPAVVPGTVLTSLLYNKLIPDPFYGMNNKLIPDIYNTGRNYYTYWFVKDFAEKYPNKDEWVSLLFRGINNSCDVFLNGHKLNKSQNKSMYLRQEYNITSYLAKNGHNRLAVIVYPPDSVGSPNGGQGGDGTIAHNITNQYVAGWDWIQPVHDRNTGIWDKVIIKKTKQVNIENVHIVTIVPGKRAPNGKQAPAIIKMTVDIAKNSVTESGKSAIIIECKIGEKTVRTPPVEFDPGDAVTSIKFPDLEIENPRLWWPNGYGPQNLYTLKVRCLINGEIVSDEEHVSVGIRQLSAVWNTHTQSRELQVNGQKIFLKGGNRILSDELLRFSNERYDAEIRYHRDMNLNLIRVWGGGITERPEFYHACDKYGLLVMQDFWVSGDCNGRWDDPMKREDTNARRKYPDDHNLFIESLADQVLMLRNHPSLAFWCGGNEIRPPEDVLKCLRDTLLPHLDGTRFFFEYSNDDSMSYNSGDGPYTIQPDSFFWQHHSFPFNSEVGSVGIGDYESLERFIPKENMIPPEYDAGNKKWKIDSVWQYHKYIGYDSAIEAYGHPTDIKDFTMKAQLVNYNQYRALIEGATAHMWDWYTGIIVWKTQNPWTAMLGQMYDVYLDPNACMYGLSEGSKPLHIMYDAVNRSVIAVNNKFDSVTIIATMQVINYSGKLREVSESIRIAPNSCTIIHKYDTTSLLSKEIIKNGCFLRLMLLDTTNGYHDNNLYALPDTSGQYSWLSVLNNAPVIVTAAYKSDSIIAVSVRNDNNNPIAFFNRISLVDKKTKKRILPAFCNNNYISLLPGELTTVYISFTPQKGMQPMVSIEGWNVEKQFIELKK